MSGRYLSAEELVKLYRPVALDKTLPTRGGQKEYAPDGSFIQAKRIESYHRERFELLQEERVAKLGSTAWGEWLPELSKVEVKKENKFWQNLGHVESTKKYLHPEEAAFLVDEGLLEIYYGGIPLSMQQVYGTVLGKHVPVDHYHVYSHLSRLGYILRRHIHDSQITSYERQIKLDKYVKEGDMKKKKRKRNKKEQDKDKTINPQNEDVTASKKTKYEKDEEKNENHNCNERQNKTNNQYLDSTDESGNMSEFQSKPYNITSNLTEQETYNGCEEENIDCDDFVDGQMEEEYSPIPHSNWNFEDISIPDFSELDIKSDTAITFPQRDTSVFPSGLEICNQISELKLCCVPSITKGDCQDFSYGSWAMKAKKSLPKNWTEYKQEMWTKSKEDLLKDSPAGVLWEEEDVKPLIAPWEANSTSEVLEKLKIVPNVSLTTSKSKVSVEMDLDIVYDVFLPNSNFKKTMPGLPNHRICIVKSGSFPPDLAHIVQMCRKCPDRVPLHWAVIDNGDVAFYCFNDVDLPIDITMG